jgi:hypothetical protein
VRCFQLGEPPFDLRELEAHLFQPAVVGRAGKVGDAVERLATAAGQAVDARPEAPELESVDLPAGGHRGRYRRRAATA